jgi:type III secretory pathway lipoprotein EscJ
VIDRRAIVLALAVAGVACDRDLVPPPRAAHDARDDADARRIEVQLAAVPGIAAAHAIVRRPFRDPLVRTTTPPVPATASILIVVDPRADRAAVTATATDLATAALPDVAPAAIRQVVVPAAATATLASASVGPFDVAPGSRRPLIATLVVALVAILALAGWTAWRERWRVRMYTTRAGPERP